MQGERATQRDTLAQRLRNRVRVASAPCNSDRTFLWEGTSFTESLAPVNTPLGRGGAFGTLGFTRWERGTERQITLGHNFQ